MEVEVEVGGWRAGVALVELGVLRLRPHLRLEVPDAPDLHASLLAAVLPRGSVIDDGVEELATLSAHGGIGHDAGEMRECCKWYS